MKETKDLIFKAQSGDRKAFQELLSAHYALIYRVAFRLSASKEEAEEMAQELCVKLVHKLDSFKGESQFSTWLYQLTLNHYKDRVKSQSARRQREKNYHEVKQLKKDPGLQEQKQWLYEKLQTLSDPLRESALLVLAEGMSHGEAAEVMECKESTISWRLHQVKEQLKVLKDKEDEGRIRAS